MVEPDSSADDHMSKSQDSSNHDSNFSDTDSSGSDGDNVEQILLVPTEPVEEIKTEEVEETQREEMGGILVYDAYAKMKGCEKIEQYFEENVPPRVATDILFSK